jgi:hypothetical protein
MRVVATWTAEDAGRFAMRDDGAVFWWRPGRGWLEGGAYGEPSAPVPGCEVEQEGDPFCGPDPRGTTGAGPAGLDLSEQEKNDLLSTLAEVWLAGEDRTPRIQRIGALSDKLRAAWDRCANPLPRRKNDAPA